MAEVYEQATLYDEHTWGAFASIAAPQDPWARAQWNRKSGFGYSVWAEAQDALSRAAHELARSLAASGPEGVFNLGDLTPEEAYPASGAAEVLVINTLPWDRSVIVDEPEARGRAAPAGMLDMFMARDVPWGGLRPPTPLRRLTGTVPAWVMPSCLWTRSLPVRTCGSGRTSSRTRLSVPKQPFECTAAMASAADLQDLTSRAGRALGRSVGRRRVPRMVRFGEQQLESLCHAILSPRPPR